MFELDRERPGWFMRVSRIAVGVLVLACVPVTNAVAAPAAVSYTGGVPVASCLNDALALSPEENRLGATPADQFILRAGFGGAVGEFVTELCGSSGYSDAVTVVERRSALLWRSAVDRVQGRTTRGALAAGDDRPLYWSRLAFAAALRRWSPADAVTGTQRQHLIDILDSVSRGQRDVDFGGDSAKRVLVTGFDPFGLDRDVRTANPSGAAALALDGTVIDTPAGPARVEAALFPVRWRDFGAGMVERALVPSFTAGPNRVDAFATISQGGPGEFTLEYTNGAFRGDSPDNENACYLGPAPIPDDVPTVNPRPQWTVSTLPVDAMAAATSTPFPVVANRVVREIPLPPPAFLPATTVCGLATLPNLAPRMPDGPSTPSVAISGGGGNYLSNEIAYRATLLRDALELRVPGGHIHTPILTGLPDDPTQLSAPEFERNRAAIVSETQALIGSAVADL
ncbi:pyrrolidone-carboxylate peptidase [Nocardia pseudobrasiliensis]|uniref:Pyrrolidone-carboxylate peptidase n=1 Tax=Nocardia pseudobrasiliensis TaxID=45979 RepID=A0A370IDM6_9NOCA|nr:pyrrolidone-carboxylate peptidase [Nocardia pseudobrasiliensis]